MVPLVHEALDWRHGVFLGSMMASETTAAATGAAGQLRRDPFAMLPFCGYHMADYFRHWLDMGDRDGAALPRMFHVNWFRRDSSGAWLWPGFGENARVLAWIFRRCDDGGPADDTPIGRVPTPAALTGDGPGLGANKLAELLRVDPGEWLPELDSVREFYAQFGERLPRELAAELDALERRLREAR